MLAMQPLVIVEVAADDPQSVILRPRYQRALDHAVDRPHPRLEPLETHLDLRPQRDIDQRSHRVAQPPRTAPGGIGPDHSRSLQRPAAPPHRRLPPPPQTPTRAPSSPPPGGP